MQQVVTLLSETGKYVSRQMFFLSNLLAFDAVLEVESPEGSDSYAFVGETPMEEFSSRLESFTRPFLERLGVSQKLDMLLVKSSDLLLDSW